MATDTDTPFVWGAGGAQLTPSQIASRRKLADAMIAQGADYSPVRSPWQGLSRVAQALMGGFESAQLDKQEKDAAAADATLRSQLIGALTGQTPLPAAAAGQPGANPAPAVRMASADPGAPAAPARPEVTPTAKVWGDKEAEDAGLYDPPARPVSAPAAGAGPAPAPSPAVATVAAAMPRPPGPAVNPAVVAAATSPLASESTRALGLQMLQAAMKPKDRHVQVTDEAGNLWDVNQTTGQRMLQLKKDPSYGAPYKDEGGNLVQKDGNGKISVLSAAEKAPTSVNEYEYYLGKFKPTEARPQPMDYETWSTAKARAAATTVNVNGGGGSDKQIFDAFDERAKAARSAASGLTAISNARGALNGEGGSITGSGADLRLALQKAASGLGLADADKVINTETFRAAIAPQVASVLKATVGTADISDSDRLFAEKAAGGSIELDKGSINRLLDIMERAHTAQLRDYQNQLDAVYPDAVAHKRERALFGVPMPSLAPAAAPVAVAPGGATSSGVKWSVE